ncbi:hypothetical protein D6C77_06426 [Aureobasidium pullulans]|uniref:Uncharacterized protein n=1 Tax=Aureobasidium pullulans TaxID=5580 RepID=A0A4S9TH73_AURPU|nr:hypothetical protein D6C91_03618 [Aureobasidium pullulans]TIA57100.1 hypothetical protein D6C77_06426 [Aureobasidium pullulans]
MSSPLGHSDKDGHDGSGTYPFPVQNQDVNDPDDSFLTADETVSRSGSPVPSSIHPARTLEDELAADDIDDIPVAPSTPDLASPSESASIPDDTPSVQGSLASSLPIRRPRLNPRASTNTPRTPSGALQPFERRFSSRFTSPTPSSRAASPAFLSPHSRQSSLSSQIVLSQGGSDIADNPDAPWEVIRWTRLRKITSQAFSEAGRRNFGVPICLAVSSSIIIGTSKGLILVFDYHQTLKGIIGQGTKAIECGAITALAISADYSAIAAGHASGHIFTWELARPAKPFLHIPPVERSGQPQPPDGHVPGRSVLHIGFLGTRRTALVSADDGGMAFSHLATRGMGAISRSVKTTRLLGRYPVPKLQEEARIKPSSVLAFAPLPLGNVEQATDNMGLTALLTPYLLVIVSTTPVAQTQHKASRPKSISRHSAMSGCLAWFPAVKLKSSNTTTERDTSETKLVYCWSNVLTVLDVEVQPSQDPADKEKPPNIFFHSRSSWECEEAIVAVQWLSRSVIGVLTISQQMIIIEDGELHVMDSVDLLHRQIHHRDIFSKQLHPVVEQADNEHSEMHGVIADAFYQSFRVYKNRLFLLGTSDLSVGTLSNWADRLTALIEHGDYIAAIQLARAYYTGQAGGVTVGLPDNADARHELVNGRLLELMSASILFSFSENNSNGRPLSDLVAECFDACVSMDNQSFLFDDVYEPLRDAGEREVFLEILQSYIMDEEVTSLPPPLVKDLVESCISKNQVTHLEELLCRLDPRTFDLDQITTLCKTHYLYDALIFVWNEALDEYVTPLSDLLKLLRDVKDRQDETEEAALESAMKVFPYLAFILTGRKYPQGDFLDDEKADTQKGNIYRYLFSHEPTGWPPGSSFILRTRSNHADEPAFPYLRLLLEYDAASFMSMMTEAFEDPYLNDSQEDGPTYSQSQTNGAGLKITRQYIVSVLLDVMASGDFEPEQTIYLDMFIARNLPKYPQFMVLSSSSLHQVLDRLCSFREDDLADDTQLSAEYLLSVYHPPVTTVLIEQLREAKFYRVLKTLYRSEHRPVDLIKTYFEDPQGKNGVFDDLAYALQESPEKQTTQLKDLLCEHAQELAAINTSKTAQTLARYTDDILERFVDAIGETYTRFHFLRTLLEPSLLDHRFKKTVSEPVSESLVARFCEQYVELMCIHDPRHVADYIGLLKSGDLDLDRVLPSMEENGVVDAAVLLMAQDGLARDAITRLCKHLLTLQNAICSLIQAAAEAPDMQSTEEAADDLIEAIEKYTRLGIWLCKGQSAAMQQHRQPRHRTNTAWEIKENDLELDELLWLNLIDAIVAVSKSVSAETDELIDDASFDIDKTNNALRSTVQQTFTALLSATSTTSPKSDDHEEPRHHRRPQNQHNQSFLYIFRAFLSRASSSYAPTLSDLRAVLLDVFAAYTHESSVLNLASQLLDVDVFADMTSIHSLRQCGWRPRTQTCELCKKRAWGAGVSNIDSHQEIIWDEFERTEEQRTHKKGEKIRASMDNGKGKGALIADGVAERAREVEEQVRMMALVVFACRHVVHRVCLESEIAVKVAAAEEEGEGDGDAEEEEERGGYVCPVCHGD